MSTRCWYFGVTVSFWYTNEWSKNENYLAFVTVNFCMCNCWNVVGITVLSQHTFFFEATTRERLCLDLIGNIVFPQAEEVKIWVRDKHWCIWKQSAQEDICIWQTESKKKMEKLHNAKHHNVKSLPKLLGRWYKEERSVWVMWYIWGRRELDTRFLWRNLKERNHLQCPQCIMEENIRMYFQKQDGMAQSRFMLFRIWTSAGILCTQNLWVTKTAENSLSNGTAIQTPDHKEHILDHINENSGVSLRIKMAELHVMQTTIRRVLHEQVLYLYNSIWIIIFWISTHGNT